MSLQALIDISRYYGSNPEYVIAGGGNTSLKEGSTLFVKGSGTNLGDIHAEGFVKMDREKLARIWEKQYPLDEDAREAAVLADMMAAKKQGEEHKRPSVETMLHDILPFAFVIHTHPTLVNGLTCSQDGEKAAKDVFGEDHLWIPITNPGYILALAVKKALDAYRERKGKPADIIFLQNHGVFVGSDSTDGIKTIYTKLIDTLDKKIKRKPDFSDKTGVYRDSEEIARLLAGFAGPHYRVIFERNTEFAGLTGDSSAFSPVSSAFTPDHIVYSGSDPLFITITDNSPLADQIRNAWNHHLDKIGRPPKIAAVQGRGIFGIGTSEKTASLALELFTDTAKVAAYSESFGGGRFMTKDKIDFINNWEVERFRSQAVEKT
ncbi:class II aldolase/adducin family protein [Treponema primitia]|uniref:class II aldolase/adducin family protein n=1 Tax=Treponema primitia TaxID=88058 RepID=UPI000255522E|nr:class II aldolase/adducin family protein [Treponema primitia]